MEDHYLVGSFNLAPEVIGHFAKDVYDAAHNGDFQILQMIGSATNRGGGLQQIKYYATAGKTGYVLRCGDPLTGAL